MAMGIRDGATLMRGSWQLGRGDRALLWFPVGAAFCLLLTAGFWLFEGAWVASLHGPRLLFVPVVVLGIYSLTFIGIFFNVALAGAADAGAPRPRPRRRSRGRGGCDRRQAGLRGLALSH